METKIVLKDSLTEMNNLEAIKQINASYISKIKQAKSQYVLLLQAGSESLAIDTKRSMTMLVQQQHLDAAEAKRKLFEELLQSELYAKKLIFMVNGSGISEDFDPIFAKLNVIRGYLTIWQHTESAILSGTTTLLEFIERQSSGFTVYYDHEIDLNRSPDLSHVLYKIKADGVLEKIRGNYDTSD